MSDVRAIMEDLEQDDMSTSVGRYLQPTTDETTDFVTLALSEDTRNFRKERTPDPEHNRQHEQPAENQENIDPRPESDSAENVENLVLVSGSNKTFPLSKISSFGSVITDRQREAFKNCQPSNNQEGSLLITSKCDECPMILDKQYIECLISFNHPDWPSELNAKVMATAGMRYKGPSPNRNGDIVYDMVECCVCKKTIHDFKPDEDPLVEHIKLHPKCPKNQQLSF